VQALALCGLVSSSLLVGNDDQVFAQISTTRAAAFSRLRPYADRFGMFRIADGHGEDRLRSEDRISCSV
jgi:hypothetical protein